MAGQVNNLSQLLVDTVRQFENQVPAKAEEWMGANRGEFKNILATYDHPFAKAPANHPFDKIQAKAVRNSDRPGSAVADRPETTATAEKGEQPKPREDAANSRAADKPSSDEARVTNSSTQPASDEAQKAPSGAKEAVTETSNDSEPATSETDIPPELAVAISDGSTGIPAVTEADVPTENENAGDDPDNQSATGMNPTDSVQTALLMSLLSVVLPGADSTAMVTNPGLVAMMTSESAGRPDGTGKTAETKLSAPGAQSTLAAVLEESGITSDQTVKTATPQGSKDVKLSQLFAAKSGDGSGETGVSGQGLTNSNLNPDQGDSGIRFDLSDVAKGHTPTGLVQPFTESGGESKPLNLTVIQSQLAVGEGDKEATSIQLMSAPLKQQPVESGMTQEVSGKGAPVVNKNEVMAQIIDHAKVMVANGHSEMEVNLKPDHLGKLQLKIAVENQTVTAKFTAESQQVKQILESNMDDLRRHLQENGIQVDSLMVSVGNSGTGNEQFARGSYNQDFRNDSGNFGYSQPADQDEVESGREETRRPVRDTVIDLIA